MRRVPGPGARDLGARAAAALVTRAAPSRPRDLAVFSSFGGRYSDHPRAVFAEYLRRGEHACTWVAEGSPPRGADGVAPRTPAHARALDAARVLVTNTHLPRWYRPRSRTLILQTWHGTPLKRIGFDLPRAGGRYDRYLRHLEREVADWDLLLSSSPYMTTILRRAFHYDGEVLEAGSPRNDRLVRATDEERDGLRRGLAADPDQRLLLYAPTFRDDGSVAWFSRTVEALSRALPPEWTILYRSHPNHRPPDVGASHRVRDMTGVPDIVDLLVAADALVTDYSSSMFDFPLTGRPVHRYVPDLAAYRDEMRGFYLDLEEVPGGPVISSLDDLVARVTDAPPEPPGEQLEELRRTFAPWDDGHASARVAARLLDRAAP